MYLRFKIFHMKKITLLLCGLSFLPSFAQDHFSGINTSHRVGVLNAQMNPAELANLTSQYEITVFGLSANIANNKVGISDLTGEDNFEDLIFAGSEAVNLRFDSEINLPSFAFRYEKWAFGVGMKAYAKLDMVDIDVNIGDAISNQGLNSLLGSTTINNNYNQRLYGTTWAELGFTVARNVYEDDQHKFNAGATFKLLFPGSFANFGADKFSGTINNTIGNHTMTNTQANLNIAYSGNLGDSFTEFSDYSGSLIGGLNGVSVDLGVNYQLKDSNSDKYLLNAGFALRNMGSMTFKDSNNSATNYELSIQGAESLDLNQFQDITSLQEVEAILLQSGFLNKTQNNNTDFKVNLPAVFSAYADVKIIPKFYVALYTKQKLNDEEKNDQITTQNMISLTPRFVLRNFELWSPWASNEISGISGGLGLRAAGFFIGSGSVFTALLGDAKQADFYLGYTFGFR